MGVTLDERVGDVLARWMRVVARHAGLAATAGVLAAAAAAGIAAQTLEIRGGTEALFDPDLPFKRVERDYYDAFPLLYENVFVVVDADTPERAGEAASALATRLRARPDLFRAVYLPGGGNFFEQHAFLYLDTAELEALADRLAEAQPYLAELARDGSLRGVAEMMARGARAVREGDVSGERLRTIFERAATALGESPDGEARPVSWAEVLSPEDIAADARRRFLLTQPVLDLTSLQPAEKPILAVRAIAEELGFGRESGVRVRITGDVALSYEELDGLKRQAAGAGLASLVLVALILIAALRAWRLVFATLFGLIAGLCLTAGFTALAIGHFNMVSVAFAVLFIGLGVDFGIHLCLRYRELLAEGRDHVDALEASARSVGTSIALCAATTAMGFFAFVPTAFTGVAELGLISGMGMFISLGCSLTLLPALLTLMPRLPERRVARRLDWEGRPLAALPIRYPRTVRGMALVLGIVSVVLLPRARFDNNPLNVRDPSSESARTFADLLERGTTSPWSLNAVATDLASAEMLAERIRALPSVARVVSVADFVPGDQQEKLDIIEDVTLFLTPLPGPDGRIPEPSIEQQVGALELLDRELRRLIEAAPGDALTPRAAELRDALLRFLAELGDDPAPRIAALEDALIGSLPEQLRTLETALTAGRVTLEKLPEMLVERMLTEDGRVRLQIFPHDDLRDQAAMAEFVDEVKSVDPNVAGSAAEMVESGRVIVTALRQALAGAVLAIGLLLVALWRRLDDTLLVVAPLCLAASATVGAAVVFDIPFNFADVIVLPLLLGIGVDSGIHLVQRARTRGLENLLQTSTARAVAYSALTTIASFGTLGFAAHRGLATLGQLLTLGVGITILCNLVVLPALVVLHRIRPDDGARDGYPDPPESTPTT